jgi:hypothetical protein
VKAHLLPLHDAPLSGTLSSSEARNRSQDLDGLKPSSCSRVADRSGMKFSSGCPHEGSLLRATVYFEQAAQSFAKILTA